MTDKYQNYAHSSFARINVFWCGPGAFMLENSKAKPSKPHPLLAPILISHRHNAVIMLLLKLMLKRNNENKIYTRWIRNPNFRKEILHQFQPGSTFDHMSQLIPS